MTVEPMDLTGLKPSQPDDQPQPLLQWVTVADLVVDRRYQREITGKGRGAIQRIADNFNWRKFGAVMCAPAEGGKIALVDGQHRAHAAAICGFERIPAVIVPMTLAEQAAGFASINRDKISIDGNAIFRAELAAGTAWAVEADRAVRAADCIMGRAKPSARNRKPGIIFSPVLIRRMVEAGESEAITAGLQAIRSSEAGENAESYHGPILSVWLPAVASNQRFLRMPLNRAFDQIDFEEVADFARKWARNRGGSTTTHAIERVVSMLREFQHGRAA